MNEENKLGLIVAFYLSKYDMLGVKNLGYKTFTEAFKSIGTNLGIKANTIKNMREEFDPLHNNNRVGWYQRELRPSRSKVYENYNNLSEPALREIIKDILSEKEEKDDELIKDISIYIESLRSEEEEKSEKEQRSYTTRGITGKKAETIFKEQFENDCIQGYRGKLIDKRECGCGYDFELEEGICFEVKGAIGDATNVLFTDKEWTVACEMRDKYILVLVTRVDEASPKIKLIKNPVNKLEAKKQIQRVITVNWSVNVMWE